MALCWIRSFTRVRFPCNGLVRRLSCSSKQAQPNPKSIPKAEKKKKSKMAPVVGRVNATDEAWLTPRVQLRRMCLGALLGLLYLNLIASKVEYSDKISSLQYQIKVQAARKELLEDKLSGQTE